MHHVEKKQSITLNMKMFFSVILLFSEDNYDLYGEPGQGEHDGDDGDELDHPPLVSQSIFAHASAASLGVFDI